MRTRRYDKHDRKSNTIRQVRRMRTGAFLALALALVMALACGMTACGGTGGTGQTQGQQAPASEQASAIKVTVSFTSSEADGSVSGSEELSLDEGATVLDALKASSHEVKAENSQYGAYVSAIDGLAMGGAYGPSSGWVYTVNGESVQVACDAYELSDGDSVEWSFVTSM